MDFWRETMSLLDSCDHELATECIRYSRKNKLYDKNYYLILFKQLYPNYLQNVKNVEEVRHYNRGLAHEKQSQKPRGAQQASQHCACLNPVSEKKKACIYYIGKE